MSQRTDRIDLAAGNINGHDRLLIELIQTPGQQPFVAISWPTAATITTPAAYDQVAATAMRLLANASTTIAGLKANKRLQAHRPGGVL